MVKYTVDPEHIKRIDHYELSLTWSTEAPSHLKIVLLTVQSHHTEAVLRYGRESPTIHVVVEIVNDSGIWLSGMAAAVTVYDTTGRVYVTSNNGTLSLRDKDSIHLIEPGQVLSMPVDTYIEPIGEAQVLPPGYTYVVQADGWLYQFAQAPSYD